MRWGWTGTWQLEKSDDVDLLMIGLMVRTKNSTTKSTHNGSPRFPVKGHAAKSGGGFHVRHTSSTAAPGACPRRRLAPPHLARLVHQETEAYHGLLAWFNFLAG